MSTRIATGTVRRFDPSTGLGVVECLDGEQLGFHATSIVDRSRSVIDGQEVVGKRTATHGGSFELTEIAKMATQTSLPLRNF